MFKFLIYHTPTKNKSIISEDITNKFYSVSENEYVYFELISKVNLLGYKLWFTDYCLEFKEIQNTNDEFIYSIELEGKFDDRSKENFSFIGKTLSKSIPLQRFFIDNFGECNIVLENASLQKSIKVCTINILPESSKHIEIESLLDFLLDKEIFYWNTLSLTRSETLADKELNQSVSFLINKYSEYFRKNGFFNKIFNRLQQDYKYKISKRQEVHNNYDDYEFDDQSLKWIIDNPHKLSPSEYGNFSAYLINNKYYTLDELSVNTAYRNTDILENQIIHGYFNELFHFFSKAKGFIESAIEQTKLSENGIKKIIAIRFYTRLYEQCNNILNSIVEYKIKLDEYIPVKYSHLEISSIAGFKSKSHYFELLNEIINFINHKEPNHSSEEKFLGITDISKLYEWFCLFKIFEVLTERFEFRPIGFNLNQIGIESRLSSNLLTENLLSHKSYPFENKDKQLIISIHYECLPNNVIDLRKSATIGKPLRPDFFIKIENIIEGTTKYLILDAKYKTSNTIINHEFQDLTLKYLHGLGPKQGGIFNIAGLFILHPKGFLNKINYYQEHKYSLEGDLPIYPSIGSLELTTNNIENLHKLLKLIIGE